MDKEIQLSGSVGNTLRVPKRVATIKICGGAMTFYIDDTMQWQRPTDEQIKNLKELLAIEVIPEDL
jgi:hypothetical protein